jgi:hypothetical protein
VRAAAFRRLGEQGKAAEAALRKGLAESQSQELRRSATALLNRMRDGGLSEEALRAARAVELLEWVGTAEARRLVAELAGGRAGAPITVEAEAALARMR